MSEIIPTITCGCGFTVFGPPEFATATYEAHECFEPDQPRLPRRWHESLFGAHAMTAFIVVATLVVLGYVVVAA